MPLSTKKKSYYVENLKKFDITTHQFYILRILNGYYPGHVAVNELKDCMPEKKSDTSRLVERMREKGLLTRTTSPNDRRKSNVTITGRGQRLLQQIEKDEENWVGTLKKLSKEEVETLNNLLDKIRE